MGNSQASVAKVTTAALAWMAIVKLDRAFTDKVTGTVVAFSSLNSLHKFNLFHVSKQHLIHSYRVKGKLGISC
jgi:hypothetical protein